MKTILLVSLFWCIQNCSGGLFLDRFFRDKPRMAFVESKLFDSVCDQDDPKFREKCPEWAAEGECKRIPVFMAKYCANSCGLPCPKAATTPNPAVSKAPAPPAFCRDRSSNCEIWKNGGKCESTNPQAKLNMAIYCGVTCGTCKEPTPEECYDKIDNCAELKKARWCTSTYPPREYEVKTNCLETCEFCSAAP